MLSQSCTNKKEIVPFFFFPAYGWIIRSREQKYPLNSIKSIDVMRMLINMPSNGHWCCRLQRTDKPSMKFFRSVHSLCFHPTESKTCSIHSTEGKVTQQAAFWPKLRKEAGTAKVRAWITAPIKRQKYWLQIWQLEAWYSEAVSRPFETNQQVQYSVTSSYVSKHLCHSTHIPR